MAQSFVNTGGYEAPVMPSIQFQDPRLFATKIALANGIGQGISDAGQLQQQQQSAAMAPLQQQLTSAEIQRQQQLNQMMPLEQQQQQINLNKASMPIPVVTDTRPVSMNRTTGKPSQEGDDADDPVDVVEMQSGFRVNPVTGQKTPFQTTGKVLESNEERQKREALQDYQEGMVGARSLTAQASMIGKGKMTVIDENGKPMDMIPAMDKDGKPMMNDDGTPMYSVVGQSAKGTIDQQNADTKSVTGAARAEDYSSLAKYHQSKIDAGLNVHPEDAKAARESGVPANIYFRLQDTFAGNDAIRTLKDKDASKEDKDAAKAVIKQAYDDDAAEKAQAAQQAKAQAGLPTVSVPGITAPSQQQQPTDLNKAKTIKTATGATINQSQYMAAVQRLAANPKLAPDFDQMFGPGASVRALQQQ